MKTEWNLTSFFNGDNDLNIEKKRNEAKTKCYAFINKWKKRNDYLKNSKALKQALDEYEKILHYYGTDGGEGIYFWLRSAKDQLNTNVKAKLNKSHDFSTKIENDLLFFELNLAKVDAKTQKKFLNDFILKDYKHHLECTFKNAKYLLTEPEEKILTLMSKTSYSNWVKMLSAFLSKEERIVLDYDGKLKMKTFEEIVSLTMSIKKKVRDGAAKEINDILLKHLDVAESEINSILENKKVTDELRKFERPDSARHISDDIDTKVVDTLIETVSKRFDISKRYYNLKAKLLGVKKLKYYERSVPYGKVDKKYSFDEAVKLIRNVFGKLDSYFLDKFNSFLDNGQIDVYPKKGKKGGGFCVHFKLIDPAFILLNYIGKVHDLTTIAHEMGHAINNELMREKQNALNFEAPLSTAEVASTFMEDFVFQEILGEANDEQKLSLLINKLDNDIAAILRQAACYKFEMELHKEFREKGYLSKEEVGKIFQRNMASYMGNSVEQSEGSENWWVSWSHIRHSFYVYSYVSGLLISKALQAEVKKNPKFIEKVKEFLSVGVSKSPREIILELGMDITKKEFWEKGLNEIDSLLKETEKLAKKLKKI